MTKNTTHALALALLVAIVLLTASCGGDDAASATETPAYSIAGRYRLSPSSYIDDPGQPAASEYYLVLNPDGTAQFEEQQPGGAEVTIIARGNWERAEPGAVIQVTELNGNTLENPETIKYEYVDGFPVATEYSAGGELFNVQQAQYSVGAGERHPLVNELHKRLAQIDYLNFTDPGDDLYTEETRKAVVAFQQAQGLIPDGVVTAATWVLLSNPQPPVATPTPWPTFTPPPSPTAVEAEAPPVAEPPPASGPPSTSALPTHTDDGKPIVYFTFDDGPGPYTQQIMDVFAQYNGHATFFVLGNQVRPNSDLIRGEMQTGQYIGNHTNSHTSLSGVTPEQFMNEIQSTEQAVVEVAGDLFPENPIRYMRPPYGAADANTLSYASSLGYTVVLWDIDPQDWRRPGADVIANHIVSSVYPGAIVLSHDGGGDRSQTVDAYRQVLSQLSAQGYVFRNMFVSP
jgi:peptidoglycan/xylan/chitin deacetylase (PgdA/CDA1 family)